MLTLDYRLSLLVMEGSQRGQRVPVTRLPFLIGRGIECHLRPVSPTVGIRHCVLIDRSGILMLADLGNTNGTYVNGVRLEEIVAVGDGDELVIGPLRFRLQVETPPTPAEPTVEEAAAQTLLDGATAALPERAQADETVPHAPVTASSLPVTPSGNSARRRRSPVSSSAAARDILARMFRERKHGRS